MLVLMALSVISVTEISAGIGAQLIAGVGLATWVDNLSAELLAGHVHLQRPLHRDEILRALADGSPILVSTVLPALALLLGHLEVVDDSVARAMAITFGVAQLLAIGLVAASLRLCHWRPSIAQLDDHLYSASGSPMTPIRNPSQG